MLLFVKPSKCNSFFGIESICFLDLEFSNWAKGLPPKRRKTDFFLIERKKKRGKI